MTIPLIVITITLSIISGLLVIIGFFMIRILKQLDRTCNRMDAVENDLSYLRGQHSINHKEKK